jgi:YD repeat-containing protein
MSTSIDADDLPGLASVDYTYDARGRLIQAGAGSGPERRVTSIDYDANGYVDSLVDPLDRTMTLDNDLVGRTTVQTLPDARQIGFGYDEESNITSVTLPSRPAHSFGYTAVDLTSAYSPPAVARHLRTTDYLRIQPRQTAWGPNQPQPH